MSTTPVTLDLSKFQPVQKQGGTSLDLSKMQLVPGSDVNGPYMRQDSASSQAPLDTIGGGAMRRLGDTAKGVMSLFAPPQSAGETTLAGMPGMLPLTRMGEGYIKSASEGLHYAKMRHDLGDNFGAAVTGAASLFPLTASTAATMNRLQDEGRDKEATGTALTDIGTLGIPAVGARLLPSIGTGMRAGASRLDNAIIGSGPHAERFGANPGAALSQNRIIGTTPASLSGKIRDLIPATAAEHRSVLANAPAGTRINTGPLVNQPFLDTIGKATDPVTGAGGLQPIRSALRTQRELNHVIDPNTGNLTPSMRNPLLTPLEANDLKSNLYGRIDYDNPSKTALANNSLKGGAYNLKEAVRSAVPESAETGQRLHNLEAAKDVLEPRVRAQRESLSGPALKHRALTGIGTAGAAAVDATGSALLSPRLSAILRPASTLVTAEGNRIDPVTRKKIPHI